MNRMILIVTFVKYKILDILDISNYRGSSDQNNSPIVLSNVGKTIQNNNNNLPSSKKV